MSAHINGNHVILLILAKPTDRHAGLWLEISDEMVNDGKSVRGNGTENLLFRRRQIRNFSIRSKIQHGKACRAQQNREYRDEGQ